MGAPASPLTVASGPPTTPKLPATPAPPPPSGEPDSTELPPQPNAALDKTAPATNQALRCSKPPSTAWNFTRNAFDRDSGRVAAITGGCALAITLGRVCRAGRTHEDPSRWEQTRSDRAKLKRGHSGVEKLLKKTP